MIFAVLMVPRIWRIAVSKSPYLVDARTMHADAAYAGSVDALFAWQREAGLSDKALARLAGISRTL